MLVSKARKFLISVIAAGAFTFIIATPVSALSNIGPDPIDHGGHSGDIYSYVVMRTDSGDITYVDIPLYFTNNSSDKTVSILGSDLCSDPMGSAGNYRDRNPGGFSNGTPVTNYSVASANTVRAIVEVKGVVSGDNNCKDAARNITIPKEFLALDTATNRWYVRLQAATWLGRTQQNRFRISLSDPGAIVGYAASGFAENYAVARDAVLSGNRRYRLPFAPDCSVTQPITARISIYDDDNFDQSVQGPTPFKIQMAQFASNGTTFEGYIPFTRSQGMESGGDATTLTPRTGNGGTAWAEFTVSPGKKYRFIVDSVYWVNILQFKLPYDSIYFVTGCQESQPWSVSGATTLNKRRIVPGETAEWTHKLTKSGQGDPNTLDWNIARSNNNGTRTDSNANPRSGNINNYRDVKIATFTATDGDVGKTICEHIDWSPTSSSNARGSQTSDSCVTVDKPPYMAVRGGDAVAFGSYKADLGRGACTNSTQTNFFRANSTRDRGSYGEYGLFSYRGGIALDSGFSSGGVLWGGAGYGGNDGSRITTSLTFANYSGSSWGSFAYRDQAAAYCQDPSPPAYSYFDKKQLFSNPERSTNTLNLNSINSPGLHVVRLEGSAPVIQGGNLGKGVRVLVFASDLSATVTIRGDITYDSGDYDDISQLPFIAVMSGAGIALDPAVKRLEGLYETRKWFNTCPTRGDGVAQTIAGDTVPSRCHEQLVINGAAWGGEQIFTNRIAGTNAGEENPSEIFNYRPDLELSLYGQSKTGSLVTEGEAELPVRY